jgi:nucleoside-diphosphate-sugar epimerase
VTHALVTGGFGFLGSHLVECLLDDGAHVHVVDNLTTNAVVYSTFGQLKAKRLTFDPVPVAKMTVLGAPFDEIYHLASVVGPVGVLTHAGRIVESVVNDTYRMIALAKTHKARLCDVSTSEIYGGGRGGLCVEDDSKIVTAKTSARLEYAVAKLACEVALVNSTRSSDLWATIVRPFNIAGPRQSHLGGFVLPRFIRQALAGDLLTVYGDGSAVRAFTHVSDVADGIVRAVRRGTSGTAYNVGNAANKTTILELARLVLRVTGSSSQICHVDPKDLHGSAFEEANDKYPNAELARTALGWEPRHDLERIVRDAVDYIRADRRD